MRLVDGWARKVSLFITAFAIVGWLIFVIGFALFNAESEIYEQINGLNLFALVGVEEFYPAIDHRADLDYFPHWVILVVGPLTFINIYAHLIIGRWFTGIFHNFLVLFYLASCGGVVYRSAGDVYGENPSSTVELATSDVFEMQYNVSISHSDFASEDKYGQFMAVEFIGAILSAVAVAVYIVMWVFFTDVTRPREGEVVASGKPEQYELSSRPLWQTPPPSDEVKAPLT